jgi:hypothetical protein
MTTLKSALVQKRPPRGKSSKNLGLINAAYRILQDIQPTTVRSVCYKLFTQGFIPDMSIKSTQRVSVQLVYAREKEIIPWEWLVDDTRKASIPSLWNDPAQIIKSAVKSYRRDYWQDQPHRVEIWSEKGTVGGVLAGILDDYGVTFRVMKGFGSATALHDVAESSQQGKPLTVFYIGDYDPSGMYMSEMDIPTRFTKYGGEADFQRIALTRAQCVGLPSFEANTKTTDRRYKWFVDNFGHTCWELDALDPNELRACVEGAIVSMLDLQFWNYAIEIEKVEVASMREFHAVWESRKSSYGR